MFGSPLASGSTLGFFGRLKSSLMGVLIGLLIVPGSLILLGWNEYRTVHRSRGLAEAAQVIRSVSDIQQPAPEINESLAHLTGVANTDGELHDSEFLVTSRGLRLQRRVEYYQWHEVSESARTARTGGQEGSKREVRYEKKWSRKPIDSSRFQQSEEHRNPNPQYSEKTYDAETIQVGVFRLTSKLKSAISNWTDVKLDFEAFVNSLPEEQRQHYSGDSQQVYYSSGAADPTAPQVGDIRITFVECLPTEVSIAAKLSGTQLGEFRTSNGEPIERLFMGTLSSVEVMDRLVSENTMIAWGLRGGGVFLCFIGFTLILGPISAMASIIPLLGRLTSGLIAVFAGLLSLILCSITIAIAWIAVRPLLAIGLLVLAGVGIYFLLRLRKSSAHGNYGKPLHDETVPALMQ